jgi:exodeoxyribonuclease V beta subunit
MIELDHQHIDLAGMNLIEASAGTGKTYAIACLYLRLLIEKDLTPEQILVVTYTEAATKELRHRIRVQIRKAIMVMDGEKTDDPFLTGLAANINAKGPDRITSRARLERALNAFDTASIFTIHGFCLRALNENAFESGSLYDTRLVTDQTELLQEIVDDFWRMRFFAEESPLLGYLLLKGRSPATFMKFLKGMLSNPKLEVRPSFGAGAIAAIEASCHASYEKAQQEWRTSKGDIEAIIKNDKGLSRSADNYRADVLAELFTGMDSFVAGGNPFALFPGFSKLTTSGIAKGKKPTGVAPVHPFFAIGEELENNVEARFLALHWELVEFCRERLPLLKRQKNIRFFDDLLNDLHQALCGESGMAFSQSLREKYRASLIDEFQDTDPVQYDIFRKIYAGTESPLFLIGDPKQAIYSFRGADIFAYRKAAEEAAKDKIFTLTGNWRSSPLLLAAFNTLFTRVANPFVYDWISYHAVTPGKKWGEKEEQPAFCPAAPLQVWHLPPAEDGQPVNVTRANELVPPAIAAEIVRLLEEGAAGKIMIEGRPLFAGDIAVIVRSNRQAGYIQEALRNLGIPGVVQSDMTIFATDEARDVVTLLAALANPASEPLLRAALVTTILGRSGDDIALLIEDERAWEGCLERFREYHQTWSERGFMVMAQALLAKEGIRGRLLRFTDGERRLTNLLHCFELIHRKAHEQKLGIEGLVTWFGERVSAEDSAEEYQIRLETDEKAVKIVTVHISKGLEYPIVFCPFMWGGLIDDEQVVSFHDGFAPVKDFGSPAQAVNRMAAQKEMLAESLRLLYVALTRAKYRSYLLAGKVVGRQKNRPETSALAYLFHASPETRMAGNTVALLANEAGQLTFEEMREQLQSLQEEGGGAISVGPLPDAGPAVPYVAGGEGEKPLAARKFSGAISGDWRVASFTSFAAHEAAAGELPDRDEINAGGKEPDSGKAEAPAGTSIFTFPRGAQAGIFFHEIFEELDFAGGSPETVSLLVENKLAKYGYGREWLSPVGDMVSSVITTPLAAAAGSFQLTDLRQGNWITELEFYFPLKFITSELLGAALRKWGGLDRAADIAKVSHALKFKPVRGMVRGFMDMVFEQGGRYYLVDWKSNHLGFRVEDYGQAALQTAMEQNLYPLQYLLYTVALNRYLSRRVKGYDYATRFGGVIYVFLRGVSAPKGEKFGYFRDLPPVAMIDELTKSLMQHGG